MQTLIIFEKQRIRALKTIIRGASRAPVASGIAGLAEIIERGVEVIVNRAREQARAVAGEEIPHNAVRGVAISALIRIGPRAVIAGEMAVLALLSCLIAVIIRAARDTLPEQQVPVHWRASGAVRLVSVSAGLTEIIAGHAF